MILDNSSQKGQLTSYTSRYENILKLDIFFKIKVEKNYIYFATILYILI